MWTRSARVDRAGLFNGKAIELIKGSELERVVVTNTIAPTEDKRIGMSPFSRRVELRFSRRPFCHSFSRLFLSPLSCFARPCHRHADKIVYLSVGPLLAEAIKCIQSKSSVSALFSS